MLRVTVEIVPAGDEARKRTIGVVEISRRAPVGIDPCDYDVFLVMFAKASGERAGFHTVVHEHVYRDGAWKLICRALEVIVNDDARGDEPLTRIDPASRD